MHSVDLGKVDDRKKKSQKINEYDLVRSPLKRNDAHATGVSPIRDRGVHIHMYVLPSFEIVLSKVRSKSCLLFTTLSTEHGSRIVVAWTVEPTDGTPYKASFRAARTFVTNGFDRVEMGIEPLPVKNKHIKKEVQKQ